MTGPDARDPWRGDPLPDPENPYGAKFQDEQMAARPPAGPAATQEAVARIAGVIERLADEAGYAATVGFTPDQVDALVQSAADDLLAIVAALDSFAADLARTAQERDGFQETMNEWAAEAGQEAARRSEAEARHAQTVEALERAIIYVKNMEMPDTGVIGPRGEREHDYHCAGLADEIREWEKLIQPAALAADTDSQQEILEPGEPKDTDMHSGFS